MEWDALLADLESRFDAERRAELAAAGTDTTHYHSFTPQEAAVMGARSALRHPAALAAWFLRIHKAH